MTPRFHIFQTIGGASRGLLCAAVAIGLASAYAQGNQGAGGQPGQQDRPGQPGQPGQQPGQRPGQQPGQDRLGQPDAQGVQQAMQQGSTIQLQQGQTPHIVVLFPNEQKSTSPRRGAGGGMAGAGQGEPQMAGAAMGGGNLQIIFVSAARGDVPDQPRPAGQDRPGAGAGGERPGAGVDGMNQQDRVGGAGVGAQASAVVLSAADSFDGVAGFQMPAAQGNLRVAAMRDGQPVRLQQVSQQQGVHVFLVQGTSATGGLGGAGAQPGQQPAQPGQQPAQPGQQPGMGGGSMDRSAADAVVIVYLGTSSTGMQPGQPGERPGQMPGQPGEPGQPSGRPGERPGGTSGAGGQPDDE